MCVLLYVYQTNMYLCILQPLEDIYEMLMSQIYQCKRISNNLIYFQLKCLKNIRNIVLMGKVWLVTPIFP